MTTLLIVAVFLPLSSLAAQNDETLITEIKNNDAALVRQALNYGANPNAIMFVAGDAIPVLNFAAMFGLPTTMKQLIKADANVNGRAASGEKPIMCAAFSGDTSKVELLLKYGADINAQANSGWTALQCAKEIRDSRMVQFLLDKGATQ